MATRALLVAFLVLASHFKTTNGEKRLEKVNLTSITFEELHRLAVLDQVENHSPTLIPGHQARFFRPSLSLDGLYDFCLDNLQEGFKEHWETKKLKSFCPSGNLYRMPVPSSFNDITSNKTVQNYIGWVWYQLEIDSSTFFEEPQSWKWFLEFDSANYMALVWLQNVQAAKTSDYGKGTTLLGSHVGGHLPFKFDITKEVTSAVNPASTSTFRLTIAISNNLTSETIPSGKLIDLSEQVGRPYKKFQPDFDFFHFAGLIGSVKLVKLHPVHLARITQKYPIELKNLSGPAVPNEWPTFNVCISDAFKNLDQDKYQLEVHLLLENKEKVRIVTARSSLCQEVALEVANEPASSYYWSLANGHVNHFNNLITVRFKLSVLTKGASQIVPTSWLYNVLFSEETTTLKESNTFQPNQVDQVELKVAPRLRSLNKQLQGFGLHHEQFASGRTMSQAAIMKDIYLLKQLGANVVRTSHYPYSSEFLDACDENGLYVIAEAPAVGLNSFSELKLALHKQLLLEMMQRDHHHPSIIMWSVANEPQSQKVEAKAYFEDLLQYARFELADYTVSANRPLTAAIAQSHKDDRIGHTLDVIMLNRYFGWYDYAGVIEAIRLPLISSVQAWWAKHPDKPIIISEFGADAVAGLHDSTAAGLFSEEYQADLISEYERVFDELYTTNKLFWGSMLWNLADFSTHNSLMRVGGNRKGVLTRDRRPKISFARVQEIYLSRLKHESGVVGGEERGERVANKTAL